MAMPSPETIAKHIAPPCRLARRYDRRQRIQALRALYNALHVVARTLGLAPRDVRACDFISSDLVDDVAFALGMWMSPDVRDCVP